MSDCPLLTCVLHIPGICPATLHLLVTVKNVSRHWQVFAGSQSHPQWKSQNYRGSKTKGWIITPIPAGLLAHFSLSLMTPPPPSFSSIPAFLQSTGHVEGLLWNIQAFALLAKQSHQNFVSSSYIWARTVLEFSILYFLHRSCELILRKPQTCYKQPTGI